MIQPNLHDWYVGQCLQGLLSNSTNVFSSEVSPLASDEERLEAMYSGIVEVAFELADAVMEIRKIRAGAN